MNTNSIVRVVSGVALLAVTAVAVRAQDVDPRWRAWTGCWTPVANTGIASRAGTVCVVPGDKPSAVNIISVSGSQVVERTQVNADGQPHQTSRDGCTGTERAHWAQNGTRVYLSEKVSCGSGVERSVTGVMSFNQQYQWIDVRGISSGESQGISVVRYEALMDSTGLPAEVMPAFHLRGPAANTAILAASAPLTMGDIADVSAQTDSGIVGAWLTERTRGVTLKLSGKQLARLADEGVASSVIDVLVAISYPMNFAVTASGDAQVMPQQAASERRSADAYRGYTSPWYDPYFGPWGMYYSPYQSSLYGYGYYSPFYGYGSYSPYYGYYYPGSTPIVVVNSPQDGNYSGGTPHGRVVKGRGYTSGSSSTGSSGSSGSSRASSPSSSGGSSSSGSSSSSSSGSSSGSASSSSGSSSSGRTAVRKPPL